MFRETSGGLEPRLVALDAVNPNGRPSSAPVIMEIPEAYLLKAALRASAPSKFSFVIHIRLRDWKQRNARKVKIANRRNQRTARTCGCESNLNSCRADN